MAKTKADATQKREKRVGQQLPPPPPKEYKSVAVLIQELALEIINGHSPVSYPEVTDECVQRISQRPEIGQALINTKLRQFVYDQVLVAGSTTRDFAGYILAGDTLYSPEAHEEMVQRKIGHWHGWLENLGRGITIRIGSATRMQLREAARVRRRLADHHAKIAALWEEMADRLPDDITPVDAVLSDSEIDDIAASLSNVQPDQPDAA